MKNLLLIFLVFTFSTSMYSQPNVNKTDANGKKIGKWIKYWENGKIRYTGQFNNDIPTGIFKYYTSNGQLSSELNYNGKPNYCSVTIFYPDKGTIKSTGFYYNQKKDGLWKFYNYENQILVKEESYKEDVKNGKWVIYYDTGDTSSIEYWKNGLRDGPWREYYINRTLRLQAKYINGQLDGDYFQFDIDGRAIKSGKYIKGKRDGIWVTYDKNGKTSHLEKIRLDYVYYEEIYEDGVLKETIDRDKPQTTPKSNGK